MKLLFLLLVFNALMIFLETNGFNDDETDRQALLEFKSHVSQEKRVFLSSWNHSFPLCSSWKGVTCGRKHKRVTSLDLLGFRLGGVISPSIGNLSFLIALDLSDNYFGGTIPQEMGNLFRLEFLNMSFNSLKGKIPLDLFNCTRLLDLELDSNHLEGEVPKELGSLTRLIYLFLGKNKLKGKLPASLGNLTSVMQLSITNNHLEGEIPAEMAKLTELVFLTISANNFSGVFPPSIYNLSSLEMLNMFGNGFSGSLRHDFDTLLPNLQELYLGNNRFRGAIPTSLSNISSLRTLAIEYNNMTGSIPLSFGRLRNLETLLLHGNSLGSYNFGDLDFLDALSNCTNLLILSVGLNRLGGDLPTSITNLSNSLTELKLQTNHITGSIPHGIEKLISLQKLELFGNMLSGPVPTSIGKLSSLGYLGLDSNGLSGEIPSSIGNLTQLETLYMSNNIFKGPIPRSLGNCGYLLYLHIEFNMLNGTIPREIMKISSLVHLIMDGNSLTGSLPNDVGRLENLGILSLGNTNLSGQIPQTLGKCLSMEELYLQGNSFDGTIPNIERLVGVSRIDFSKNNLTGSIPEYLSNFSKLEYLNLSINNFEGMMPSEGNFHNSTKVFIFGNKKLCGGIKELKLKPCIGQAPPMKSKHVSFLKKVVIGVTVGIVVLLFIALVSLWLFIKRKKKKHTNNATPYGLEVFHEKISYEDLRNATNGFSSSNLIGSGSFGTVFKALLPTENKVVAVKILNLHRRGAMKSFIAECESLKDIRHRNLVKLLTACSSIDFQGNEFRALIYEFMSNGSVDRWLHPEEVEDNCRPSRTLTLLERLDVVIDVASVLDYLHVNCHEPIVHCDIKPSNILLDDDLTAHVSDFGMSRLLLKFDKESFLNHLSSVGVRGTIGYAAPEYGTGGQPSIHGDVYSFGVLILEIFTGKRPTDTLFGGNYTLYSHTKCCEESPTNRLSSGEAMKELISIKERFFKARRTTRF
ncbi:unnamed protein product [Cochlearia groenlandica]